MLETKSVQIIIPVVSLFCTGLHFIAVFAHFCTFCVCVFLCHFCDHQVKKSLAQKYWDILISNTQYVNIILLDSDILWTAHRCYASRTNSSIFKTSFNMPIIVFNFSSLCFKCWLENTILTHYFFFNPFETREKNTLFWQTNLFILLSRVYRQKSW